MRRRGSPDALIPFEVDFSEWMTVKQAAVSFKKSERTINNWCVDGTFKDAGIEARRDLSGRWMILLNRPRLATSAATR
jgi:hypothetical protein